MTNKIGATVDVYFRMLTLELAGENYTKTEFRREVERDVDRSSGAIEYKFNNVSAALDGLGAVWSPATTTAERAGSIADRRERFEADSDLRSFMPKAVADGDVAPSELGVEVDPPAVDWPAARDALSRGARHQFRRDRVLQSSPGARW